MIKSRLIVFFVLFFFACDLEQENQKITLQVSNLTININENPQNGQVLGQLQAKVSEGSLGFSMLSQSPDNAMTVNANNGTITVADSAKFDFETNPQLNSTILVSSLIDSTIFDTALVTVNLQDLDDGSGITLTLSNFQATINENPFHGQAIGQIQSSVSSGSIQFVLISQSIDSAISVHPSTGFIFVDKESVFDFETNPLITALVAGNSSIDPNIKDTATVSISLNDLNENGITITVADFEKTIYEFPKQGSSLGFLQASVSSGT
ncbi:MAG: cadherin repeat domain-containing protein, partial [Calditrichaeota bacterium]|nr:cadherin repeat domain-containing protein [Calditrichota bacterium]